MPINNTQIISSLNVGTTNGYPVAPTLVNLQDATNYIGVEFTITAGPTLPATSGGLVTSAQGPSNASRGDGALIECFFCSTSVSYATPSLAVEALARVATVYRNYLPFAYAGETRTYNTRQIEATGPFMYVWFCVPSSTTANTTLNAWSVERSAVTAVSII